MKKTTILLGMLSLSFAYAQQTGDPTGKVGVNTNSPTETLDVKGTIKVQDLPTEGQDKVYNGQAGKNSPFTPTKTVVADEHGVLGVVGYMIPSGSDVNTALQWDDQAKKWKAVAPAATGGNGENIYNTSSTIPAGQNRTITLANPGTGGVKGATLNFALPEATDKAFNIIQDNGARGFSLSTKEAGQKQNLINFFDNAITRKAYLGFTDADAENDFRFRNEAGGKIFLENEVKIKTIPTHDSATEVLVDNNGVVSKKAIADLVPAAQNDEAWKKAASNDRVTNADDASNIYRSSNIGIGNFSGGDFNSPLHIKKANNIGTANNGIYKFATFQISDKAYTADDLASTLEFTDTNGNRYAFLGDFSLGAKNFEARAEKGYNLILSSYADGNGRSNDKALIELSGEGQHPAANDNNIKIKFNTGRWNNTTTSNGVTTVSRHGNWYFGADGNTTPADQKVVIGGALRFDGGAYTGLSHNKNPDTPTLTVPEGTMFYNSGHFFGVIPEGGGKKWKQLDNVDYTGQRGINVSGNTISLPDGTTNGNVLTWDGNNWTSQALPAAPTVHTIYSHNGNINQDRTVTLGNNNSITWTGGSGFNIVRNGEALALKASATNKSNFIGFYRSGASTTAANGGRTAYVGFGSETSSDFMIDNEITSGKILMKDAVKVEAEDYEHITFVSNDDKNAGNSVNHRTASGKVEWYMGTGHLGKGFVFRNNTDSSNDKLVITNNGSLYLRKPNTNMSVTDDNTVGFAYNADTGRVGIGVSTSPSESIDVSGTARLRGLSAIGTVNNKLLVADGSGVVKSLVGTNNGQVLTWNGSKWVAGAAPTTASLTFTGDPGANGGVTRNTDGILTWNNGSGAIEYDLKKISTWRQTAATTATGALGTEEGIYRNGVVNLGNYEGVGSSFKNNTNQGEAKLHIFGDNWKHIALYPSSGTNNNENPWYIGVHGGGFNIRTKSGSNDNGNRFIMTSNGSLYLTGNTKNIGDNGNNAGFGYDTSAQKLTLKGLNSSNNVALHLSGNHARLRLDTVEDITQGNLGTTPKVLIWNVGNGDDAKVVKATTIDALLHGKNLGGGSSPLRVVGSTTPATSTNYNSNLYLQGALSIGDFSSGAADNIGNLSSTEKKAVKLAVKGAVLAGSFKGSHGAHIFPDYVFQKYYTGTSSIKADYAFQSLSQVEDFVKANGHLPGYKSAADIKAQGYIDVMETQISNVEKIEELYLHTIEQEKALKEKDAKIKALEERLERLEKLIK